MPTVRIVIDVDDDTHYAVSLHEEAAGGFSEVSRIILGKPLPLPDGDEGVDLAAQLRDALGGANPDVRAVRRLGKHLWSLAFDGAIGSEWTARNPSRTILDIRPPELQRLPWEALQLDLKVMFMLARPFVRAPLDLATVPALDPPLRVLVIVGDGNDQSLCWREELCALEVLAARQPHRLHVEALEAPDRSTLRERCEQELRPHVLHVIGHGKVVDGVPGVLINHPTDPYILDPDIVVNQLQYTFPLVVLNACHTGDSVDGVMGLGEAFRDNGAVATVCMQGAIRSTAAADFSRAFYGELVAGEALDVACVAGRHAVANHHDGVDAWLPQLVLRAAPGPLLTPPRAPAAPDPNVAIDRAAERRQLLFALTPALAAPPFRAAIVHGGTKVGKTFVARSAGHVLRSAGAVVRYVDLMASDRLGWQAALRAIRDPATGGGIPSDPLPREVFALFNAGMNEVALGKPPPAEVDGMVEDLGYVIGAAAENTLDHINALFEAFLRALSAAAGGRRLILVLDHLHNVDPDVLTRYIVPKLLTPIAMKEVDYVSVMVVAGATVLDPLRPLTDLALEVPVMLPEATDFRRFAAAYGDLRMSIVGNERADPELYDQVVTAMETKIRTTWSFDKLEFAYKVSSVG